VVLWRIVLTVLLLVFGALGVHPVVGFARDVGTALTPVVPVVAAAGQNTADYLDLIVRIVSVIIAWLLGRKQPPATPTPAP
jgi:putative exporter of polyketide antibiotics